MRVRSLAYRTDLSLLATNGEVVEREGYRVVRSPRQPEYRWGNFLLFDRPPGEGDRGRWEASFDREFAGTAGIRHRAFGWDDPEGTQGEDAEFLAAGYEREEGTTLVAEPDSLTPEPRHRPSGLEVRPLASDADWEAAARNQVACRDAGTAEDSARRFRGASMAVERERVEAGHGAWYGAFLEGRLVGDLGLFVLDGIGRYREVGTAPSARRRGVCGSLVHAAATRAFEGGGARTLVLVAEEGSGAARVYASLGFRPVERQAGLCLARAGGGADV